MLMAMSMKESGWMIKRTDKENINMLMELAIQENGSKINSMVSEKKLGLMAPDMRVNTEKAKKMAMAPSTSQMEVFTQETSCRMRSQVRASTYGPMVKPIMANGKLTRCTAMARSCGETENAMRDNLRMTCAMAKEGSSGAMGEYMKGHGLKGSSTA